MQNLCTAFRLHLAQVPLIRDTDAMPASNAANPGWSVAEAAGRIGVSTSTLRSWERRHGIAPTLRTPGGHRRYTTDDLAALVHLQRLRSAGVTIGSAAGSLRESMSEPQRGNGPRNLPDRFAEAAAALDAAQLARTTSRMLSTQGAVTAWTDTFVPYLQALGRRWQASGREVEREHLVVAVLTAALDQHASSRRPVGTRVLLAATETEHHVLPLHAAAAALAETGVGCTVLGRLPALALDDAVLRLRPAAVVLWARSRQSRDLRQLRALGPAAPVVCGAGPGWTGARLPRSVVAVPDLPATVDVLGTVARRRSRQPRPDR
jgi:MerR family transcriptional regulator, light-induced transcriptional regulator